MRRATFDRLPALPQAHISIHALHEESDTDDKTIQRAFTSISIHALHEESDLCGLLHVKHNKFQSTLSMRRATYTACRDSYRGRQISIHALHEESDWEISVGDDIVQFQSTLSMRRATRNETSSSRTADFNPRSP